MQNAKDTFYEVLRGRLAALNPGRTVVVRGVTRPGVVVVENELESAHAPVDCFVLRWTEATWEAGAALPLATMGCEIGYATAGTTALGGMDRGRALAAMDAELLTALTEEPQNAAKVDYTGGGSGVPTGTRIWWGAPACGEAKATGERMQRSVRVAVMSFQEAGEL